MSQFWVKLHKSDPGKSHIVVGDLFLNDIQIHNVDIFGTYLSDWSGRVKTHGFMEEPGTYTFKVRFADITQSYIVWLMSLVP